MNLTRLVSAILLASAAALFASTSFASASPTLITASPDFKFAPAVITVHVNEPVTLSITSSGGVHALQSSDLGIPQTLLMPGKATTVTFTPGKVGTYVVHCAIPCGPGHGAMALTIKVVA